MKWSIFYIILSLPISLIMPYNKKLWSTSFALVSGGIAGVFLCLFTLVIDMIGENNK
jgi:predicted acyltransferase